MKLLQWGLLEGVSVIQSYYQSSLVPEVTLITFSLEKL